MMSKRVEATAASLVFGVLALACRPRADAGVPGDGANAPAVDDAPVALVWPDEPFRAAQPAPGPLAELELPQPETFRLENGLEVYLIPQRVLPTVHFSLQFDIGETSDPSGKVGMNALCMELLSEGTRALDKVAFAEKQADHAVSVWSSGGTESSTVGARGLKSQLGPTLDLLSGVVREPGLRQADLDRIRDRRKAQLAQSKATPASIAQRLYPTLVFGAKHPYGRLETDKSLSAVTVADCRKIAARLKPKRARLFVVGMLNRDELEREFGQRFKGWTGAAPAPRRVGRPSPRKGQIILVHTPTANQSQVWVGHPGPARTAEDYEATEIMAQILGGGFTSRINMNLREDKGFSYGGRGSFAYNRQGGYFVANSSVRADATADSLREIAKEIRRMRSSDPTPEEVGREIDGRLLALPASFASATRSSSAFEALVFFGLPLDWYARYQARLEAVDIGSVHQAATKHLREDGHTVLVVGDATVVLEDLRALAEERVFGSGGLQIVDADGKPMPAPTGAAAGPAVGEEKGAPRENQPAAATTGGATSGK